MGCMEIRNKNNGFHRGQLFDEIDHDFPPVVVLSLVTVTVDGEENFRLNLMESFQHTGDPHIWGSR